MATVLGLNQCDVRIAVQLGQRIGRAVKRAESDHEQAQQQRNPFHFSAGLQWISQIRDSPNSWPHGEFSWPAVRGPAALRIVEAISKNGSTDCGSRR